MLLLSGSPWGSFLLFFLLVAALKWPSLTQLPVWDESTSIFPAAEYLANHQFNVAGMLREPECGAHWASLLSFVTAAAMFVWGCGSTTWMVLHLLQWGLGAAAAAVLMAMLLPWLGRWPALLAALLFLAAPVTLGQLGCMYVEIPLVLFSVAAVAMYLRGRPGLALLFCALACFTKESGFIVAAALGCAAFLEARTRLEGLRQALAYWFPSLLIVLVSGVGVGKVDGGGGLNGWVALAERLDQAQDRFACTLYIHLHYVPDHPVLLLLCGLLALFLLGKTIRLPRKLRCRMAVDQRLVMIASLFLLGFLALFWGVIPVVWENPNYVPRYLLQALPFVIVLLVVAGKKFCGTFGLAWILVFLVVLGVVNRKGWFYAAIPFNDMALAERSEEYADGYAVTRECLAAVERDVPADVPVICCPFTYLLTQHPALGYVSKPLPNAVNIIKAPAYLKLKVAALPERYYLLYDYPKQGGAAILRLVVFSYDPAFPWEVRSKRLFSRGMFNDYLVEIVRKTKAVPVGGSAPAAKPSSPQSLRGG